MKKLYSLLIGLLVSIASFAIDFGPVEVSVSADVVSHYLWRGQILGGLAIQPCVEVSAYGFTAGVWANVGGTPYMDYGTNTFNKMEFNPELDVYLSYTAPDDWWSVSVTQFFYFDGSKFFYYGTDPGNSTQTELHAQVKLAPSHDIYFNWNTYVGGGDLWYSNDSLSASGGKLWSSYASFTGSFELPYDIVLDAEIGFSPYRSQYTYTSEDGSRYANFAVNNISIGCQKHWYAGGDSGELLDLYLQAKVAFNLYDVGYEAFAYGKNFNWMVGFGFSL